MTRIHGDVDVARVAALIADGGRARILLALADGRALPASVLAAEAGVAASTASEHLGKLSADGLICVYPQGRHRYYRLAGPHVAASIEALARLAPTGEIRSLKQGTRAHALRRARTCYDHLAGRLGVGIFSSLVAGDGITGGDGRHTLDADGSDRLSARGCDIDYRLTPVGQRILAGLDVALPARDGDGTIALRYCVDWSEQRHHLSGVVGRALCQRLFELGWIARRGQTRAVELSEAGRRGLTAAFGDAVAV